MFFFSCFQLIVVPDRIKAEFHLFIRLIFVHGDRFLMHKEVFKLSYDYNSDLFCILLSHTGV